jgi:hypothetical protein
VRGRFRENPAARAELLSLLTFAER